MSTNRNIKEFIAMVAFLISLGALSIDAVLPAFDLIAIDLDIQSDQRYLIISTLILGMSAGQLLYGPWADHSGRRPPMIYGLMIFTAGTILSWVAPSFELFILGRFFQGVGAAAPRVVTTAIIRDSYVGREMAKIMSFSMSIFILIPVLAPSLGQLLLIFGSWRTILGFIFLMSLVSLFWFIWKQEETLKDEFKRSLNLKELLQNSRTILTHPQVLAYTSASGIVFGGFLGYLNSAQHIFQNIHGVGEQFSLYFAVLAVAFGVAFIVNAKWVTRYGMVKLSQASSLGHFLVSLTFLGCLSFNHYQISLIDMMLFLIPMFFFIALIFSNMQSLAMVPMGKMAGIASSLIGSVSTFMAVPLGAWIGSHLSSNLFGLAWGFAGSSAGAFLIIIWAGRFAEEGE